MKFIPKFFLYLSATVIGKFYFNFILTNMFYVKIHVCGTYENIRKYSKKIKNVNKVNSKGISWFFKTGRTDKPNEKNKSISIAFRDGSEDLSEEEAEYLEQQLNQFRQLRKRLQHEDK